MTDKEILLSLSNMLEPIREDIWEIKNDVAELKSDVAELKGDVTELKSGVAKLESDMTEVKCRLTRVENNVVEINSRLKRVELTQENSILPRLDTIEACYTSTYERYKRSVDGYDNLKQDMSVVKKVVAEHSKKLQMIS